MSDNIINNTESQYIINGRQLSGRLGGVQRYIREILLELDNISSKDEFSVIVPKKVNDIVFKNLKVIHYGFLQGLLWENICLPLYLITRRKKCVNLCTVVPFLYPFGIVTIHDVMLKRYPQMKKALKPIPRFLLMLNYCISTKFCSKIITVSETSKKDICEYYHVSSDKLCIISNAWQHMNRVFPDENVFNRFSFLIKQKFFLALSANRWQKNFKWIIEVAKRNPDCQFAIVGEGDNLQKVQNNSADNVHFLGYLSDEEIKALYSNCKAFLFPSLCEGFGIPPLEAMACGAKVIVSNTSCLPEIFGKSAYYIDPYNYDVNLNSIINSPVAEASETLNRYSWLSSAKKLAELLNSSF